MKKERIYRIVAFYLLINLLGEICFPTVALALTSGPAQPETSSFEPVSTSEMVDLFSGDFNYNIPLLDVEGYPVNISYHSNITMDQEASWVGLGWNINPGTINRNMRGIPDDFSGDEIKKELSMKPNRSFGLSVGKGKEIAGLNLETGNTRRVSGNVSFGINYNNYTGISFEMAMTVGAAASKGANSPLNGGLGFSSGANGLTISPNLSYSARINKTENMGYATSIGTSYNSREGLKGLTLSASVSEGPKFKGDQAYAGSSINHSIPISFGKPTYIPQINMAMRNIAVTLSFKLAKTAAVVEQDKKIGGFFSQQKLEDTEKTKKSYGYLYLQDAQEHPDAMLDFNRDKDGPFGEHTSTLPSANLTYDLYNVSGQGLGGTFRPYRNDVGYVYDHAVDSRSDSYSLGVELGTGAIAKLGADFYVTDVNSGSGQWNENNVAKASLKYRRINEVPGFEPSFFKQAGELNVDADPTLYSKVREEQLVRMRLVKHSKFKHEVKAELEDDNGGMTQMPTGNYRTLRPSRNQNLSFIPRSEYAVAAISKSLTALPNNNVHALYDMSNTAIKNHIGEFTSTKTDGTRYVYGIASYNVKQREVSFNASQGFTYPNPNYTASDGLVSYNAGADNSKNNSRGQDNFFSSTEIPPYAHSYLLTSVLSPDYVDISGDGPSSDDLGTYTKFTYKRTAADYKWRIPYDANKANFNEGIKPLPYDDQGNYLYGEKEIRFLESIETKNHIAVFTLGNRRDDIEAAGENGGRGTVNKMAYLQKISLYSRLEYVANPGSAVPIKEVNFVYDYSLCTSVPNNDGSTGGTDPVNGPELSNQGGKLTLKKIYFTYGSSKKGKSSPYVFNYSTTNPTYNMKNYDRWGMFKANTSNPGSPAISNSDFPYSVQDKTTADINASAWQLKQINLPSGGQINVEYESDDYAYVQDQPAMQMFSLTAVGNTSTLATTHVNGSTMSTLSDANNVLFFALKTPIPSATPNPAAVFYQAYLKGIKYLYFRSKMRVVNIAAVNSEFEYVSGYAEIFSYGLAPAVGGNYTHAYVQLKNVCKGDNKDGAFCDPANPMSKAAWQYARIHTPREALNFNNNPDPNLDPEDVIFGLVDVVGNVIKTFMGVNNALYTAGIGKEMVPAKSWIRLLNPDCFKLGGGSRVSQLTLNDNWRTGAGGLFAGGTGLNQTSTDYGQVYSYTTKDAEGNTISSGVAQNEPSIGNDENPLKLPFAPRNADKQEKLLAPDDFQYQEAPIGESVYPANSVGYSKVTVSNLPRVANNVKRHATGKVVYEYYTAKDFPVIAEKNELIPIRGKSLLGKLLNFNVKDYMSASQGFRVILNDMHGKLRSQMVYAEDKDVPVSGLEYIYKTSGGRLANVVTVINKDGTVGSKPVGIDFDVTADFREQETESVTAGVQANLYMFVVGPLPMAIPPIIPSFNREHTRFRSATLTKVINKYGILDKTIAYDLGSKATTEYLAYDAITGEPLLTKTITSFDDNTYSLKYPAHLAYDGMGPAFKNSGVLIKDIGGSGFINAQGKINTAHAYYPFVSPGDLFTVYVSGSATSTKYWVQRMGNDLFLVDNTGLAVTSLGGTTDLRVYRSGRRNLQSAAVGMVSSFYNPLDANRDNVPDATLPALDESYGVIQAGAAEYSDAWKTFCECGITPGSQKNPYLIGTLGNWRKKKDYAFLTTRNQTQVNGNSNTRVDGTFKNYTPFWSPNAGNDWSAPADLATATPKWTWVNEVTQVSTNGVELENKDALGRYSSAYLGYNYTLAAAVVANSKYKQSGFDGFEDYAFRTCTDDHLGFKQYQSSTSTTRAHTGKKSVKLTAGQSIIVTKVIEPCQ